jgi:hypothetical protein
LEVTAEQQDVPKEEAAVETIRAVVDWYENRHLAIGHIQRWKKRTQGDDGPWQNLAAAEGWLTRRAISAPHKWHGCQGPGRGKCYSRSP